MKIEKHGNSYGVYVIQTDMNAHGYFDKQLLAIKLTKVNNKGIGNYEFTSKLMWASRTRYFIIFPKFIRERWRIMVGDYVKFDLKEVT